LRKKDPAPNVTWKKDGNQSVVLSAENKLELVLISKTARTTARQTNGDTAAQLKVESRCLALQQHIKLNFQQRPVKQDIRSWLCSLFSLLTYLKDSNAVAHSVDSDKV